MDVGIYRHGLLIFGGNLFCFLAHLYASNSIYRFLPGTNFGTKSDAGVPRFVPKNKFDFYLSHNRAAKFQGQNKFVLLFP